MSQPEHLQLMCLVLDGEATSDEVRKLDRILKDDAAARARFEELQEVFAVLARVPKLDPPEGLIATVLAKLDRPNQPFPRSRVSSLESHEGRGSNPETTTFSRDKTMSSQRTNGKRNVYIGIGLAVVGVLLIGHYALDFPGSGDNATGTVAPAQRYRAPQIQAQDVKLGDQAVAQLMQSDAVERLLKDPAFQALAQNPAALQALAANASAFAAMAAQPKAFAAMAANAQDFAALAQNPAAFAVLAQNPSAAQAMSQNASAFAAMSAQPNALAAMAANANAFAALSQHPKAFAALAANHQAFAAMAQNASAFAALAANANALVQLAAPDHLRGRLVALYLFAFVGLAPLGSLLSGTLVEVGGTGLAFVVAGTVGLGATAFATLTHRRVAPLD